MTDMQYWEIAKVAVVPLAIIITQKFFDFKNAREHDNLRDLISNLSGDLTKVVKHLELDIENSEYISTMGEVKAHYVSRFGTKPFRIAADTKSNTFILMVAKTIKEHPDMSTLSWTQVSQDFDTGFEAVKGMMAAHISYLAEEFYIEHAIAYRTYKAKIESIFMGLGNSRKERFIKLSNDFMLEFLSSLLAFEKKAAGRVEV